MIAMQRTGLWTKSFNDPAYIQLMESEFGAMCIGNMFSTALTLEVGMQYHWLKQANPTWSEDQLRRKAYMNATWNVLVEKVHFALDAVGLVPGYGEVADLANGIIYTIQGEGPQATLSFAAAVPVLGWTATGAKYGYKITTVLGKSTTLRWFADASGTISFGSSSQLRGVIGLTDPAQQAHHLIPWATGGSHEVIQAAAKLQFPIHLNDFDNGVGVVTWRNQPNHNLYDLQLTNSLNTIKDDFVMQFGSLASVPGPIFRSRLKQLQDCLRAAIIANPSLHLNTLPISGC
jgi:hypothetical protein